MTSSQLNITMTASESSTGPSSIPNSVGFLPNSPASSESQFDVVYHVPPTGLITFTPSTELLSYINDNTVTVTLIWNQQREELTSGNQYTFAARNDTITFSDSFALIVEPKNTSDDGSVGGNGSGASGEIIIDV